MGAVRFLRRPPLFFFTKNIQMCKAPGNGRFFCWSWRSAGPEGEGGCFDSPSLPPLDSLPTRNDQDGALDPKAESRSGRLAEKALYCASDGLRIAFSGRHPPCAPICMRALRARLHPTRRTKKMNIQNHRINNPNIHFTHPPQVTKRKQKPKNSKSGLDTGGGYAIMPLKGKDLPFNLFWVSIFYTP